MPSQEPFLLKAAFLQYPRRRQVLREHMGNDLDQLEFLEGVVTNAPNNRGHYALAPKRLRQPVADLDSMGLAELEVIEAAAADQGVVAGANGPMHCSTLSLGDLGDESEPCVGIGIGVRERYAKGAVVDVAVVEMLDEGFLVRGAILGQLNQIVHEDLHGGTWPACSARLHPIISVDGGGPPATIGRRGSPIFSGGRTQLHARRRGSLR